MRCIIFCAGHATQLEAELRHSPDHASLAGIPKALLPGADGQPILSSWYSEIKSTGDFVEGIYLVTNADKYKHYERWATANSFPVDNIVNDGTTTAETRLGAVGDFELCLRKKSIVNDDVLVIAGDMMFQPGFDLSAVLDYFKHRRSSYVVHACSANAMREGHLHYPFCISDQPALPLVQWRCWNLS